MPPSPSHAKPDPQHASPGSSGFNTPISSPSGHHTPAAGYRTATGTLSNVFASLWGTYSQQEQQQQQQQQQQRESGPSRLQPPPSPQNHNESPVPSIPGGWGNLLSWGPAAARNKTSTHRKSASPSRASPTKSSRPRGAIPFSISAPLEADNAEKDDADPSICILARASQATSTQRRSETAATSRSPASSPRRRPLAGIFEDLPSASASSPPHTPAPASPSSSRSQLRDLPPTSPTFKDESPNGAYATLSRLQSKPSVGKLRSGSGFLWTSTTRATMPVADPSPSPTAQHRPAANWSEALARAEKLDTHVRRIVFQAGLDYETRPMVVLAACCLPDPNEVDYDALLDRIMDTMDLFVENDYTVIYFAGGGHHRPGWNWIWRAYRRLDRRFRKNLKKLYLVHPTFFTRSLLQFVSTGAYFVSPKFSKKVSQLYTLSALAQHVPLTQIDIPPEVLQWNARYEKHVSLPASPSDPAASGSQPDAEKVFGVELSTLMGEWGESGGVPRVVRDCVEAILGDFDGIRPAEVEGIFRRSPSSALLKAAQESYDRGHPVSLEQYRDPHMPAVLLKLFLRSLPRPIFPAGMYALIRACPPPPPPLASPDVDAQHASTHARDTIDYLRTRLLPAIEPPCSGILLSYVLAMLHTVSQYRATNKMDAANLATVIAPNLVASGNAMKDVLICRVDGIAAMGTTSAVSAPASPTLRKGSVSSDAGGGGTTSLGSIVRFCIENYYEIFDEITFVAQANSVQGLVDELAREGREGGISRSPSVASRRLPSLHDTPASGASSSPFGLGLGGHRRGESTNSDLSQASASPWGTALHADDPPEDDRKSGVTTGRSIASRDAHRAPAGFHRATIARHSSGSLRLTKGRLGSNTNLRSSFTPVTASTLSTVAGGADTDGLTAQPSGVALTGASALATFSSPSADRVSSTLPDANGATAAVGGGSGSSASSSPLLSSAARRSRQTSDESPPVVDAAPLGLGVGLGARRSTRRELSEVAEADGA
ncbi:related to Rho-GTPase-activating protein 1 [Sporisorium reilianum SRZ2]|uniref:Related to Rho-GTPase-activating protein 1 n=1 Tax=Sporisorium reilianum (strain SRZ2) TaxID=999809 RepID=E6ZPD1_SPORE|nr:related to Rho-GTPase-activating protein 1 [Sporisorium reilianum SRZ2]